MSGIPGSARIDGEGNDQEHNLRGRFSEVQAPRRPGQSGGKVQPTIRYAP